MTPGDRYRVKAAELMASARLEPSPMLRLERENLALAYLRLADQADRNEQTQRAAQSPRQQTAGPGPQQQQQQSQPDPKPKPEQQ